MKAIVRFIIAVISGVIAGLVLAHEGIVPMQYSGGLLAATVIVFLAFITRGLLGLTEGAAIRFAKFSVPVTLVVGMWTAAGELHNRSLTRMQNSFEESPSLAEQQQWWREVLNDNSASGGKWAAIKLSAREGIVYGSRESHAPNKIFHNTRRGLWVWVCWAGQFLLMLIGTFIGCLAVSVQDSPAPKSHKRTVREEHAEQVAATLRKNGKLLSARAAEAMINNSDDLPEVAKEIHYQRLLKEADGDPSRFLLGALETVNHEWVIEALQKGADPNKRGHGGRPAICLAARAGNLKMLNALIEHGADLNLKDAAGADVLDAAAQAGQTHVVEWLLESGRVEQNAESLQQAFIDACAQGHLNTARQLYLRGTEATAFDTRGFNALHHAAQRGHDNIISWLLTTDVDPDQPTRGKHQATPLHFAALHRHPVVVETLLAAGANPDGNVAEGVTPLMHAADAGNLQIVRDLLESGADRTITCRGLTAFDYAVMAERPSPLQDQVISLLKAGCK